MTVAQIYALYRAGHAQARRSADACGVGASELVVKGAGLTPLERVILELALHDVTNGTAMRSAETFGRAVEQGADLLRSLGLCLDPPRSDRRIAGSPVLDEAA